MSERKHFRIKFPQAERPGVAIGTMRYEVLDCSETGLRIKTGSVGVVKAGTVLKMQVDFRSGMSHKCEGKVVRQLQDLVMVALDKPIPVKILKAEVDRILATYGSVETTRFVEQQFNAK